MSALKIYDPSVDEYREPTQADIDRLVMANRALGLHREVLRKIVGGPEPKTAEWMESHLLLLRKMADCE